MFTKIFHQDRKPILFLFSLYFLSLLFLFAIIVASSQMGISPALFTCDPALISNIHPFVGVLSNIGIMLWIATATIGLFSWMILRNNSGETRFSIFLLCSSLMTMLLSLDDLFMFHETILGKEEIVFSVYGCLILCGIVIFKRCILKTKYLTLLIAFGFFGLSLLIDLFQDSVQSFIGEWRILFEDGFKFIGIISWFGYFSICCFTAIRKKDREYILKC